MISKKICMLGAFSVGKTSLVSRFVHSVFSDKYLSTVGVKISKKELDCQGTPVTLILWDMEGKDIYAEINTSYLRGAMGYFLVADGTRAYTLQAAMDILELVRKERGDIPFYLLMNKADIRDQWEVTPSMLEPIREKDVPILLTSAKTGDAVEEAFNLLTRDMLAAP